MSLVVVVLNLNTSKRNGGGPPVMVLPNAVIPLSDLHGCYSVTTLAQFWPMIPPFYLNLFYVSSWHTKPGVFTEKIGRIH